MPVAVEADIHSGLPAFTIVGLPDAAVQESRERVRAALVNSGFDFPLRRITVNLAPADLRKAGPGFDLGLAAALLAASGQITPESLAGRALCGELGLDGSLRPVRGAIVIADAARRAGCRGLVLPRDNESEAALVAGIDVTGADSLTQLVRDLTGEAELARHDCDATALLATPLGGGHDMSDVRGQHGAKRALEIAAAGGHNLLMIGPPGAGKSMLARRVPTILPPLSLEEALETTRVHSVAGLLGGRPLVTRRPFRAPHHSTSAPGLVGGGRGPSPGEVSLALNGVLFLDELSEFVRPALEALRQPLEEGVVEISRAQRAASFPARFMLIAATNPCPCGHAGDARRDCSCHPVAVARHQSKLSGPLLDRIDLVIRVEMPTRGQLADEKAESDSLAIRTRVVRARSVQARRLASCGRRCNAEMRAAQLRGLCDLDESALGALADARERIGLSMRGHDRALRVARTIADLAGSPRILREHATEALSYRDHRGGRQLSGAAA